MLTDGIQLLGTSTAENFTIDNGSTLPATGNNVGELFYLNAGQIGLYVYGATGWEAVGSALGSTSDLPEGSNLYFTTPRAVTAARGAISLTAGASGATYNSTTGVLDLSAITNGGTPGGASTHVQFNNGGVFGGSGNLTWNNTNNGLGINQAQPNSAVKLNVFNPTATSTTSGANPIVRVASNGNGADAHIVISDGTYSSRVGNLFGSIYFSTSPDANGPVERFRILGNGAWSVGGGTTNTGSAGNVLTSAGNGSTPTWAAPAAATFNGGTVSAEARFTGSRVGSDSATTYVSLGQDASASGAEVQFMQASATSGNRSSRIKINTGGNIQFTLTNDGITSGTHWLVVNRSADTATDVTFATTSFRLTGLTGGFQLNGSSGNAGEVLTSQGGSAAPTWTVPATGGGIVTSASTPGTGTLTGFYAGNNTTYGPIMALRNQSAPTNQKIFSFSSLNTAGSPELRFQADDLAVQANNTGIIMRMNRSGLATTGLGTEWATHHNPMQTNTFDIGTNTNTWRFMFGNGLTLNAAVANPVGTAGGTGALVLGYLNSAITSVQDAFVTWANGGHALVTGGGNSTNGSLVLMSRLASGCGITMATGSTVATQAVRFAINDNGRIRFEGGWSDKRNVGVQGQTIDLTLGNHYTLTMTANSTFAFAAGTVPAAGQVFTLTMYLTQDATGSRTVTWPASVKWPGGGSPILTTTPAKTDIISLTTHDGGTTWFGAVVGLNY